MTPRQARLGTSRRKNYCSTWQDKARTEERSPKMVRAAMPRLRALRTCCPLQTPAQAWKKLMTTTIGGCQPEGLRPPSVQKAWPSRFPRERRPALQNQPSSLSLSCFLTPKKYICLLCLAWHIVQEASPCHGRRRGTFTMIVFKQSMDMSARWPKGSHTNIQGR